MYGTVVFQDTGHQAMRDSDHSDMKDKPTQAVCHIRGSRERVAREREFHIHRKGPEGLVEY